jgi:acetyl-CoA carboxylase biotin carboxyl carrier protein
VDLDLLKQILNLVREHELSEFEIEQEGLRLKIRKDVAGGLATLPVASGVLIPSPASPGGAPTAVSAAGHGPMAGPTSPEEIVDIELAVVKSPIVGTFHRSPEPGAPAFVEVGSLVKKGQVLCIIEAMKLMNEIDSECDGEIVNVYVETGHAVQYGERLFAIRTK